MLPNRFCKLIVDLARNRSCRSGVERIEAQRGQRKHLKIDAARIHRGDTAFAKVKQLGLKLRKKRV